MFHSNIAIRHTKMEKGWLLLTSSERKGENDATIRGVGLILSPRSYKALASVESRNPCIMIATFIGNPSTGMVSYYIPTNVSSEDDVEGFHGTLTELVNYISKHVCRIQKLEKMQKRPGTMTIPTEMGSICWSSRESVGG